MKKTRGWRSEGRNAASAIGRVESAINILSLLLLIFRHGLQTIVKNIYREKGRPFGRSFTCFKRINVLFIRFSGLQMSII